MNLYTGRMTGRVALARVPEGADLLASVNQMASEAGFKSASVQFIGAVRKAVVQVFDQAKREYVTLNLAGPLEIVTGTGNVSLKDGQPFAHVHAVFSDLRGVCSGGHLAPGTEVFMAEVVLAEIDTDRPLERKLDRATGLALWE